MKVSDGKRHAVLALGGALALGALGAATALGGDKLKTESETVTVDTGEHGSATATCPRGTKAISGGFDIDFEVLEDFVGQSSRTGGRRWTSEAFNSVFGDPGELTSFAYCRDEKVKSRATTESVPGAESPDLEDIEYRTVTARCKRGTRAVSGGFDLEPVEVGEMIEDTSFLLIVFSRKAGGRKWEVRAANQGGESGDVTAQVNCRDGKRLKTRRASTELDIGTFELDAECKRKERVVSGGFAGSDFAEGGTRPADSVKTGKRRWHLEGFSTGDVTAYAYCEKK